MSIDRRELGVVRPRPRADSENSRGGEYSSSVVECTRVIVVGRNGCASPPRCWKQTLKPGVILLVPDAGSVDRLVSVIPNSVAISTHLSAGQRYQNFLEVASGHRRIVIGTRSAVFAPVENLSAVIMWDDFNDAYCDAHAPYWDAREVAALRSPHNGLFTLCGWLLPLSGYAVLV